MPPELDVLRTVDINIASCTLPLHDVYAISSLQIEEIRSGIFHLGSF